LRESSCSSESFRFCLNWATNFSSLSSASSSGKVTWTEDVSDVAAGVVDALGEGAVGATGVFELFGATVQPVNKQARKARLTNRRFTIFWLL
jgi:hypothetical protein